MKNRKMQNHTGRIMKLLLILLLPFNMIGQTTKTLTSPGKLKETTLPLSEVLIIIPAGEQVKIKSGPVRGLYYAEYKELEGFINEIYFAEEIESITTTNQKTITAIDCNEIKYTSKSSKPSFESMLKGVKYAVITNSPRINGHVPAFNALFEYLKEMGFESVEYMDDEYRQPKNLCEEIFTYITFNYDLQKFSNIQWHFVSPCDENYTWQFSSNKIARAGLYDNPKSNFYNVLREMYQYKKPLFNSYYTIELPRRQTCWTEAKLKDHINSNGCDRIEGIYENSTTTSLQVKYKVAVRKMNGIYHLIYLSGALNTKNWNEGEIKATLEPTATPNFYKAKWIMADKSENNDFYISFESGLMNVLGNGEKYLYLKLFPTVTDDIKNHPSQVSSSGTGWAISANGYIVTNHHVIEDAKSIKVRGINEDFSILYNAKTIIVDKKNDLAILKIDDSRFTTLGNIPYKISKEIIDVGSSIYTLGYPLLATMGEEVKLTNGIISSKSGFQGDITSYQITAAAQPGSSGGALFNEKGDIVGVVNAKHTEAENASYAIKSSYLINLIESLPESINDLTANVLNGKTLPEQVKILKKYIYIIEVN